MWPNIFLRDGQAAFADSSPLHRALSFWYVDASFKVQTTGHAKEARVSCLGAFFFPFFVDQRRHRSLGFDQVSARDRSILLYTVPPSADFGELENSRQKVHSAVARTSQPPVSLEISTSLRGFRCVIGGSRRSARWEIKQKYLMRSCIHNLGGALWQRFREWKISHRSTTRCATSSGTHPHQPTNVA